MLVQEIIATWSNQAATKTVVLLDAETGGLNDATNATDPNIPPPLTGAQFYPVLELTARFFDGNLVEIRQPMTFVIHHPLDDLHQQCSKWSIEKFKDTLFLECEHADISLEDAQKMIAETVKEIGHQEAYLLGNSVSLDKAFITHQMKDLHACLHYRIIDVSTLKTLFGFLFGEHANFKKSESHRTEQDVEETLGELRYYLNNFIKSREVVAREVI
ncbi:exonuclease domain-containing protein [Photobacterium galatheae]|uniref:Exonuclease domain-containing protein n=1 Tax=Photobacterium galatheae TaxID=1654360 RepID=A0A066RPB9_9GAMM|nr:exonuclease domain-containing protein [Photobacterium galatheae]KDM90976.1 hypothetical protein EA58_14570 [Photobacterium galatheae]MCM0149067.1 hypothetical protein [Photobacterium galatheae]